MSDHVFKMCAASCPELQRDLDQKPGREKGAQRPQVETKGEGPESPEGPRGAKQARIC